MRGHWRRSRRLPGETPALRSSMTGSMPSRRSGPRARRRPSSDLASRPAKRLPGAYEEFGVPLTTLRKQLFELMHGTDARSALAEACLTAIEEIRDEAGRPDDEPRHPLIESDLHWPRLAGPPGR